MAIIDRVHARTKELVEDAGGVLRSRQIKALMEAICEYLESPGADFYATPLARPSEKQ